MSGTTKPRFWQNCGLAQTTESLMKRCFWPCILLEQPIHQWVGGAFQYTQHTRCLKHVKLGPKHLSSVRRLGLAMNSHKQNIHIFIPNTNRFPAPPRSSEDTKKAHKFNQNRVKTNNASTSLSLFCKQPLLPYHHHNIITIIASHSFRSEQPCRVERGYCTNNNLRACR